MQTVKNEIKEKQKNIKQPIKMEIKVIKKTLINSYKCSRRQQNTLIQKIKQVYMFKLDSLKMPG